MLSFASNRLEQYPQLNPNRRPLTRFAVPPNALGPMRVNPLTAGLPATAAPTGTDCLCPIGTRSVVRHFGQRTSCPACPSSADSG
jgi:hypothetical protein